MSVAVWGWVPYSLGSAGMHVTFPVWLSDWIAPIEQELVTRSCTWVGSTCVAPTEAGMILRGPTEFGPSLTLPTEKFLSWALPTLFGGRWMAAQLTPPSATNRARNDTASGAEGRGRRIAFPPTSAVPAETAGGPRERYSGRQTPTAGLAPPRGRPYPLGRTPQARQLLLAVWIALSVVSTATVRRRCAGVPSRTCALTVAG